MIAHESDGGPILPVQLQARHWDFVRAILNGEIEAGDGSEIVANEIHEQTHEVVEPK